MQPSRKKPRRNRPPEGTSVLSGYYMPSEPLPFDEEPMSSDTAKLPAVRSHGSAVHFRPQHDAGVFDLIWHHRDAAARLRREPELSRVLSNSDDELGEDLAEPLIGEDPADVEDRRDVFDVLVDGFANAMSLAAAMRNATRRGGKYQAPLVLVSGRLTVSFDDVDRLRATVVTVRGAVDRSDAIEHALQGAETFLKHADRFAVPGVAANHTSRIHRTLRRLIARQVVVGLQRQVERVLLQQRCYQRSRLFGAGHFRAELEGGEEINVVAYLPDELTDRMPLYPAMEVRLLAELHPRADAHEKSAYALVARAIARKTEPATGQTASSR